MTVRETYEQIEKQTLSSRAQLSIDCLGRKRTEEPCPLRTCYCRDRDRIIHSKSFRRLKSKTQVFLSPKGDHYRTRLTHTLEVSQIARTIARAMRLNEDLTEAIALGHDLGHTPFGHAGEQALASLNPNGFSHYKQSVRVLDVLENYPGGLNITYEVIDGISNHTKGEWPKTLEGQIVRHADRIAYINHDIEDAIAAGLLRETDLPREATDHIGQSKSKRISTLISDLIKSSYDILKFSPIIEKSFLTLHDFMFSNVYLNGEAKHEEKKVQKFITELYLYYRENSRKMPDMYCKIAEIEGIETAVSDYISGMSDAFAIADFENIFVPQRWMPTKIKVNGD